MEQTDRDRLFANIIVGITNYEFSVGTFTSQGGGVAGGFQSRYSWLSEIIDYTVKADFDWAWTPRHYIRFGVENTVHQFRPGASETTVEESGVRTRSMQESPTGTLRSHELALYAEDEIQLYSNVQANVGMRLTWYAAQNKNYGSIEPRISIHARLTEKSAAKLSLVRMQQHVHLLSSGASTLPANLWIPSMDGVPPQRGYQLAAGLVRNINKGRYELTLEGYLKRMHGYATYATNAHFLESAVLKWPDLLQIGQGTAYGLEFFVQKKQGWLTGWVGYTLARATAQFEDRNRGKPFPDNYDRRHDVSVVVQAQLSESIHASTAWIYGSGYPIWAPVGRYRTRDGHPTDLVDFGPVNSARAPAYHRLDLNMQIRSKRPWGARTITVGVYNAYNRKNPFFIYPRHDGWRSGFSFRKISLLHLIPALSWKWQF